MKHLGDITKINGADAPVVDVIIGGSPCQDLSVAGKRAGLAGERSGLYMDQIRIIKEMRNADALRGRTDVNIRPRYMVWENVPGAFSSNGGKDFAAVLEEAIRVAEPQAPPVSVPPKGWPTSGCFMGDKWSVAWRVLDAQFWGVPQRRRRIALVADFGGQSAPEILFVRESVSGHFEPGKPQRKETAGDAGKSSERTVGCDVYNLTTTGDKAVSLTTSTNATGTGPTVMQTYSVENHPADSRVDIDESGKVQTLTSRMGTGGGNVPMLLEMILDDQGGQQIAVRSDGKAPTLRAETHGNLPCVVSEIYENKSFGEYVSGGGEPAP